MDEKYKSKMFTEEGYETLLNYTKNLIKEYARREKLSYPFSLGIILGIPFFNEHFGAKFNSQEELCGRIQGYMQLLMISILIFEDKGVGYTFEMPRGE